ncbi:MAG: hypothetical protein ICV62_18430 [Cyanobacteria bacterium Co-bin13]|nr:hypothetical protein [Cyanobacteria bacterium Co-bin13]
MVQHTPGRPNDQKDDQWQKDLNPDPTAGTNAGQSTIEPGRYDCTAADIKELYNRMEGYSKDDLRQIPILKPGARLKQGAVYLNLSDPARNEYTAMADMSVDEGNYVVPKTEVGYELWNRLRGVEDPARLNEGQ